MASMWQRIERMERAMRRPGSRSYRRRSGRTSDDSTLSFRPNAPRMITVVAAVALTVAGLVLTDTVSIGFVSDLLAQSGVEFTREHGFWMLLGSPVLLIVGSLLPGI